MTDDETSGEQTRQSEVLSDIVEWSRGCPAWQQDALRRLFKNGTLTDDDFEELLILCKAAHDPDANLNGIEADPLDTSHVRSGYGSGEVVALTRIRDVHHVNALAEGEYLGFREQGLSVIYGRNASGKSGYVRILKKACRARASDKPIFPDVYAKPPEDPATAVVEYSSGGTIEHARWTDGEPTDEALSAVSIFDADCASVHVDKANELAYIPRLPQVIHGLADACLELQSRLGAERNRLESEKPASLQEQVWRDNTEVGKLMARLGRGATVEEVESLATVSDEDKGRINVLKDTLDSDPTRRAERLRLMKTRLDRTVETVRMLGEGVSDAAAERHKALAVDARSKADALRLLASDSFQNAALPQVGSETWTVLWNAARSYSETEAYPEEPFPFTGDDARCVLCQQTLGSEAADRLKRFEEFVKGRVRRERDEAVEALALGRQALKALYPDAVACREIIAEIRHEHGYRDLARSLSRFLARGRQRVRLLVAVSGPASWPELPELPPSPGKRLNSLTEELGRRVSELQRAALDEKHRASLQRELEVLKDRLWLADHKGDVTAEITRQGRLDSLDKSVRDTITNKITRKASDIAQLLVTEALRKRFSEEVERLGITHLPVCLVRKGGQYGTAKFQVSLGSDVEVKVGSVLSEGEHRCIALAAFLSELETAAEHSGIVFDDPVCSLDHEYCERFAERLAEEATRRQVIVFTHHLWFLFALDRAAGKSGLDVQYRTLVRTQDGSGVCQPRAPFDAQPVQEALEGIQEHLNNTQRHFESGNVAQWSTDAKGMMGHLRDCWELAVEGVMAPVLRRYDSKVRPHRLAEILVLTDEDVRTAAEAYGTISQRLHTHPAAGQRPLLAPEEIQREIDTLKRWHAQVSKRRPRKTK